MPTSSRKGGQRVNILGELHGEVTVYQPVTIAQIGGGGAQIEMPFPLQLDSLHDFRLTLGEQSVVVKGRIAHCRISHVEQDHVTYLAGIEFIELPEHVREAIAAFIATIEAGRRDPASE